LILKKTNSGATLLELIVTIVVAALAAGLILNGYIIVVKLWNNYTHKIEASGGAWVAYLKIEHMMAKSYHLKKVTEKKWVFYKDTMDSCELTFENKSLFSSDSSLRFKGEIDTFYLERIDTSGIFPVWECGLDYSQGKKKSGMSWRTVCRGNYGDTELPSSFKTTPVQAALFWENKGK
jgi:Tfp pilus assembly protein PilE